ncbi:protein kinase domain-containing protein [Streptomyces sp. NPDC002671]
MLRQGDVLDGRYRLDSVLGRGGFGTAWRAHDVRIDRPVAVKVGLAETEERAQRLIREARIAGNLTHPNIAMIHDFGRLERDGRPFIYIVMELVRGEDLAHVIARGLPPFAETLLWARQICAALAAAHDVGIVHRDITPANLILTDTGTVKVLDFGIAKRQEAGATLTAEGVAVGTPTYMAPERMNGRPVDGRSDLYALGCILMELWTGHPPFRADDAQDVMVQHMVAPPPLPSASRGDLPPGADELVLELLAKAPGRRPGHAREVERRLALLAGETSAPTVTASTPPPLPPLPSPPHSPTERTPLADPVRSALRRRLDQILALPPDSDLDEFVGLLNELIPEAQRELGPDDPLTAEAMLARALRSSDHSLSALVPKLIRVFGPEDPRTIQGRARHLGRSAYDGVEAVFGKLEEVIALATRVLGPWHRTTLHARLDLAAGRMTRITATGRAHPPFMPVTRAESQRRRALYEPLLPDLDRGLPDNDMARYEAHVRVAIDTHLLGDHEAAARYFDELLPLRSATLGVDELPVVWSLQHAHNVGESGDPQRAMTMLDQLLPRIADPEVRHRASRLRSRFKRRARRSSNGTGGRRSWFGS